MQKVAPQGLPKLTNWAWLRYGPERFFYDPAQQLGCKGVPGRGRITFRQEFPVAESMIHK